VLAIAEPGEGGRGAGGGREKLAGDRGDKPLEVGISHQSHLKMGAPRGWSRQLTGSNGQDRASSEIRFAEWAKEFPKSARQSKNWRDLKVEISRGCAR